MKKIIVIGGGAAGMIAAISAAGNGKDVRLLEKNAKLGKKLLITGKGRCNMTNAVSVDSLLDNIPGNPYFLYSSFYALDSYGVIEFFKGIGVETVVERGNRVFPKSEKASDVVKAFERELENKNVKICLNTTVKEIVTENKKVKGVTTKNGEFFKADAVIVATGGLSYPATGSTGDGHKFARAAGHTVTKLRPSLSPLITVEKWVKELQGLSLKNISIEVRDNNNRVIYRDFGEMLFTHYGVSGPVILSASRYIQDIINKEPKIYVDLKPALDEPALDQRLLRDFEKYKNKNFRNALDDLLPQKLIPVFVELSGIPGTKKVNEITKAERKNLVALLKSLELTVKDSAGYSEAVVTTGGVCVDEIEPGTMGSKIINGLYFAGEVLDVDGLTGGFNLQIAFSTGYLAGKSV